MTRLHYHFVSAQSHVIDHGDEKAISFRGIRASWAKRWLLNETLWTRDEVLDVLLLRIESCQRVQTLIQLRTILTIRFEAVQKGKASCYPSENISKDFSTT
jgi:hypothetical protein